MKKRKKLNPLVPIQNAQLLAIEGVLENTLDSFERKVRRWFSKEHSTPYLDTFKIPWDELLLHYYESSLANISYNEVFYVAVEQYLPEFMNQAEQEDQAFADSLLEEQKATLKAHKKKMGQGKGKDTKTQGKANKQVKTSVKSQSIKTSDESKTNKPLPKTMSLKFDDSDPENI